MCGESVGCLGGGCVVGCLEAVVGFIVVIVIVLVFFDVAVIIVNVVVYGHRCPLLPRSPSSRGDFRRLRRCHLRYLRRSPWKDLHGLFKPQDLLHIRKNFRRMKGGKSKIVNG